ncbi:hydrogenase maturation protease [Longivirga aurantiaca]|uniref:Hydrogenase maturation protease n=1 Tax=Longivirga aurantiaca TaxID=1837743 RepID=A0ABW1T0C0_9ACTN
MTGLIIGLGNAARGDDAIGVEVARRIAAQGLDGVEVAETDDPTGLLDLWAGAESAVVVDAMVSHGSPGTVACFDVAVDRLPGDGWSAGGTHALGLAAAVELSRALGTLPARLVIVGVEAQDMAAGAGLSSAVLGAADDAARVALDALGGGGR